MCFLILIVLVPSLIHSQKLSLTGKIIDKLNGELLSYANVRIANSTYGTAANLEGKFEFKLQNDQYKIITSFIGYKSDTTLVNLTSDKFLTISLEPISYRLPEITVLPRENPANEIIRRAIKAKHKRENNINSYIFKAYTKGLAKTTKDFGRWSQSIGVSIGEKDTGSLKITGIIENESIGYFQKPDQYRDEIVARKQSANTSATINILTGGRLLQNFYANDIRFFNRPLPGPIADNALDYYYYILEDTLAMDKYNVFKINFEPIDKSDPGFYGKIFIIDDLFYLAKLDVNLNEAANPGGIFTKVNVFQQFVPFQNNIYMPIDYRIFAEGNFLGMIKFGFELNSIYYNYQINSTINEDKFSMVLIKVLPDADTKDSTYWKSIHSIPNTLEEVEAYRRIDSLEAIPRNFWDDFSFLSSTIRASENFSFSGPLSLYSFNHINGHTLNFGLNLINEFDKRFFITGDFAYGLSDRKFQTDLSLRYLIGEYRTATLYFNAYNKLTDLFGETNRYNNLSSTLSSLLGKYEFRDYYYTKGFDIRINSEIFPVLRGGIGFLNRTDKNAFHKSDFSIFNRSKKYRDNKHIFEVETNALTSEFSLDFRKFIEDGYSRRRISFGDSYAVLSGRAIISNNSIIKSDFDFQQYELNYSGFLRTFKSGFMNFQLKGIYSSGSVPFQMLYSLPGNIESYGKPYTFRTLRIGEIFGDRGSVLFLQHNWGDELFRLLNIPFIKDLQLILTTHFNFALLEISDKSKKILPHSFSEFKHPFYEIGFGIGQALFPFTFEFTWKLNYKGKNDFVFGLSTVIIDL
jgi:hypothetical protein